MIYDLRNSRNILLSYVDFFAICTGLARPLPIDREKNPVKADIIQNSI